MDEERRTPSWWSLHAQMTRGFSVTSGQDKDPEQVMRRGSYPFPAQGTLYLNITAPHTAPGKGLLHFSGIC